MENASFLQQHARHIYPQADANFISTANHRTASRDQASVLHTRKCAPRKKLISSSSPFSFFIPISKFCLSQ